VGGSLQRIVVDHGQLSIAGEVDVAFNHGNADLDRRRK
jgi:hypothetical protein